MSDTTIINLLTELKLHGAVKQFMAYVNNPTLRDETSTDVLLESLLVSENNYQKSRKQDMLLKQSKLMYCAYAKDVLCDNDRGVEFKKSIDSLLTMSFIEQGQNLNLYGCSGSGKTFIATVLGNMNCLAGRSTLYTSTNLLLDSLAISHGSSAYNTKLRNLVNRSLLILDDFCLTGYDAKQQTILFDVLNGRYDKRSTIIISQKTPDKWLEVLNQSALAESIIERANTNNFNVFLNGTSRRKSLDLN